jgi:hypothetical protein
MAYTTQILVSAKKCNSPQWPIAENEFRIRIIQRIRNSIKNIVNETGAQMRLIDENSQRSKI